MIAEVSVPAMMNVKASAVRSCTEGVICPFSGFGARVVSKTDAGRALPGGADLRRWIWSLHGWQSCWLVWRINRR